MRWLLGRSAPLCMQSIHMASLRPCIQWGASAKFRKSSTLFFISKRQPLSPARFCTSTAVPTQGVGDQFEIDDQADQVASEAAPAALAAVVQNASGGDHVG